MTDHSCEAFGVVVDPGGSTRVCMRCQRLWVKDATSSAAIRAYQDTAAVCRAYTEAMWRDDYQETQ